MAFNDFPSFNIDDIVGFNNNGPRDYDFGFGGYNLDLPNIAGPSQPDATTDVWGGLGDFGGPCWDLSNLEGPSQPYTGVEVWGDLNKYPDFPAPLSPNSAPTSLNPANEEAPGEGYFSSFYQRTATSPFLEPAATPPQYSTHSPVLTLSWGDQPLPEESYATPTALAYHLYEQPQVVPNPDGLSSNLFTAAGSSSLSTVHTPPYYNPPCEELLHQLLQAGPYYPDMPSVDMVTRVAPPEYPLPPPVASSSGPKRTGQHARGARRHNPIRATKKVDPANPPKKANPIKSTKKIDPRNDEEGWLRTLARFRGEFDALYSVQDGHPPGGLVPETAFAETNKFIKEDLKQSPFQDTAAGKGERVRDLEDYLKRLVNVILPKPAPGEGRSKRDDEVVGILSRLAQKIEDKLEVINDRPSLVPSNKPKVKRGSGGTQEEEQVEMTNEERKQKVEAKGKERKNNREEGRRDEERQHLGKICLRFKLPTGPNPRLWTKKEALILGVMFLLYGPEAFSDGIVRVRPATQEP